MVLRPNDTNVIGQMVHLARLDPSPTTSGPHHCHGRDKLALYTATEPKIPKSTNTSKRQNTSKTPSRLKESVTSGGFVGIHENDFSMYVGGTRAVRALHSYGKYRILSLIEAGESVCKARSSKTPSRKVVYML